MALLKFKWNRCSKKTCKCKDPEKKHGPYVYFKPTNIDLLKYSSSSTDHGFIYLGPIEIALENMKKLEFFKRWRKKKKNQFLKTFNSLLKLSLNDTNKDLSKSFD